MAQTDHTPESPPGIIEEPRTGASIPTSENVPTRNTTSLDLIAAAAAAGLIILPLLAGAIRG